MSTLECFSHQSTKGVSIKEQKINTVAKKPWAEITRKYALWDHKNVKGFFGAYRCFSNFHGALVEFEGSMYPTSEHAFMAAKTADPEVRLPLQVGGSIGDNPVEAKKYGRTKIVLRDNWEQVKVDFMFVILHDKFTRHMDLGNVLLDTGDKYLEETNHWNDKCWGVDSNTGEGDNNLGKVLMRVRAML